MGWHKNPGFKKLAENFHHFFQKLRKILRDTGQKNK